MATVAAGFAALPGGMDASVSALMLPEQTCARAVNVVFRGGSPKTRPPFLPSGPATPAEGYFRGMGRWSLEDDDYLVLVVGGTVLVYSAWGESYIATFVDRLAGTSGMCYFTQVHKYMVIQNGETAPVILEERAGNIYEVETEEVSMDDQSGGTRTLPDIPPGTLGVFAHGRYHVVPATIPNTTESGLTSLLSGDVMLPDNPKTALGFSETEYLNEGGAHGLPLEMGRIGGLGVLRSQSGTGHGLVVVLGRNGSCAFDFARARESWKEGGLSSVLFSGAGCRSPYTVLAVNSDLVYRGIDGLRTLKYALQQHSGTLTDSPISMAVDTWLDKDALFLKQVSAAYHDNRVLVTTGGSVYAEGGTFGGIISCDVLTGGIYDGMWTGGPFRHVVSALYQGEPCFFVYCNGQMYRLSTKAEGYDPNETPVKARLETKSYTFESLTTNKQLQFVETWFTEVQGPLTVKVWARPHGYPLWWALGERNVNLDVNGLAGAVSGLRFSVDFNNTPCDPVTKSPLYASQAFQFAIEWTGRATLERFRAVAEAREEAPPEPCDTAEEISINVDGGVGMELNDFDYFWRDTP